MRLRAAELDASLGVREQFSFVTDARAATVRVRRPSTRAARAVSSANAASAAASAPSANGPGTPARRLVPTPASQYSDLWQLGVAIRVDWKPTWTTPSVGPSAIANHRAPVVTQGRAAVRSAKREHSRANDDRHRQRDHTPTPAGRVCGYNTARSTGQTASRSCIASATTRSRPDPRAPCRAAARRSARARLRAKRHASPRNGSFSTTRPPRRSGQNSSSSRISGSDTSIGFAGARGRAPCTRARYRSP